VAQIADLPARLQNLPESGIATASDGLRIGTFMYLRDAKTGRCQAL